ncbi:BatA domain-containing protein [Seonamhaeicola aphaedonensis]|uniref:Putative membrane protein (TIGR02226 family) n=1 Tax=Seonamhaeicola aphaedonensis TaxID=1461338 RepID=A0A3D9H8P8_9FLAO|nr:BatA domain-containing protein [Seonamhaeicola aphaedonensis]RED45874.1 putative membrane protein (TIGR02226 family) [Seonamhaeicola aphaedonensis]
MQFKHPELLYALLLLIIPIIVHLFQLRRFKKESFTNVAFLKEIKQNSRKSSQIKKWLILCTRLLLLAAIVIAFAQPFTSKNNGFKTERETVVYIDNSFSMQAKGNNGELLKRAVQDLVVNVPENENISVITNNGTFKNTTIKAIKNDLLQLNYSPNHLTLEAALLKSEMLFSKKKGLLKNLVFISDFQQNNVDFNPDLDSLTNLHLVQLKPINTNNIAIDTVFISETTPINYQLKVILKNSGNPIDNIPVSVYNGENLIAKTSVEIDKIAETSFTLPANEIINGKITIDDVNLRFDNNLFFNINHGSKINVLSVNEADDSFLDRIFSNEEFNLISTSNNTLNYNLIDQQHLIVINEIDQISNALVSALKHFVSQGGSVILVPSEKINIQSYNHLLANFGSNFTAQINAEKSITTINYAHPLYKKGVFEKQVLNFQYPKVESFYEAISNSYASVLSFEDGKPFLYQHNNVFVFTSALNNNNSNFKNSPLIVPTLYNIAKQSFKTPELYYIIGKENEFEVETQLQQDDILSLVNNGMSVIPRQKYFNNKVIINTSETPNIANIYSINNKAQTIKSVSFNYDRRESILEYQNFSNNKDVILSNSIHDVFNTIKSDTKVNALWKWFAIFALILLITEMLILKYFK